jgi:rod shape-determining protein MreC
MRNLGIFFIRYYSFFLFLFLEVIAFSMLFNSNNYQSASFFNSSNKISGKIFSISSNVESFINLSIVNDSLSIENARLKNQVLSERYSNKINTGVYTDTSMSFQQYTYIQAKVINNTILKRNNYLTLNRGRIHGIRKNMGVICGDGIVGIVKDVSDHYCSVISFLHKDARISAQLNSSKDFGSLVWDGLNPKIASLRDIPTHVKVKIGDSITTTGFSSIFPENVMVGKVNSVSQKNGDNFFEVSINLSTNFSTLRYVYVVSDILADEKVKIEGGRIND